MNSAEQHQRAMKIFDHVCDLPLHERHRIVEEQCSGDLDLQKRVESMLRQDGAEDEFIRAAESGRMVVEFAAACDVDTVDNDAMPDRIGNYQVLRKVGEGGMGIIYEAEQDFPKRRVALKVLRPGLFGPSQLKRFEHEAHMLGHLQHPGIASIHEAGLADLPQGRQPYFVMEFIDGESIVQYASNHSLNVKQRLELVARVCDAVHHAHQKGIIHRDLKPGNVLVVSHPESTSSGNSRSSAITDTTRLADVVGQPKVLDFGIARVTNAETQPVTIQTEVGQLVGTLAYMSPEQIFGDSTDLDIRCDVWALGVILYEILVGRRPHELNGLSIPEAARLIREHEPDSLGNIDKSLRGDIETIVAKAMEPDRERRYGSAADFAADIRRFLGNEPIVARPATTIYQLKKFASRNRGLVGGLVATFVAGTIGLGLATYGFVTASSERNAKVVALENEQAAREVSDAVTDFLTEMLAATSPKEQGKDVSVREVMDKAALEVGNRFANLPLVEAKIRNTIGRTYVALGEYIKAEQQLNPAIELWNLIRHYDKVELLEARVSLAEVHYLLGKRELAAQEFEAVLTQSRAILEDTNPVLISAIGNVAFIRMQQGRYDESERLSLEAIDLQQKYGKADDPHLIDFKANLALLYTRLGRTDEAEPLYVEAIEDSERIRGSDHPETLLIIANLATLYISQDQYALAAPLLQQSLEAQRRVLGRGHRQTLITLNNLAFVLRTTGKLADAETVLKKGIADAQSVYADGEPSMLILKLTLGDILRLRKKYDEAESILQPTLNAAISALGDNTRYPTYVRYTLAEICLARSELARALELARGVVRAAEQSDWATPVDRANYNILLARIHIASKRFEEAEDILMQLYQADESGVKIKANDSLINLYVAWGRIEEADHWRKQLDLIELE